MVSESRVTWAISVPILVFLGLSVLDLGPMYETDTHHRLMLPPYGGGGIIVNKTAYLFKLHLLGWAADGILRTGVEFVRIVGGGRQNGRSRVAINGGVRAGRLGGVQQNVPGDDDDRCRARQCASGGRVLTGGSGLVLVRRRGRRRAVLGGPILGELSITTVRPRAASSLLLAANRLGAAESGGSRGRTAAVGRLRGVRLLRRRRRRPDRVEVRHLMARRLAAHLAAADLHLQSFLRPAVR